MPTPASTVSDDSTKIVSHFVLDRLPSDTDVTRIGAETPKSPCDEGEEEEEPRGVR